jgi:hypothetical protein
VAFVPHSDSRLPDARTFSAEPEIRPDDVQGPFVDPRNHDEHIEDGRPQGTAPAGTSVPCVWSKQLFSRSPASTCFLRGSILTATRRE